MSLFKKKKKEKHENVQLEDHDSKIKGSGRSFAVAEAHKRLRTNVFFSFPDNEKVCRVVGVTSSVAHEGKSTTSLNLAYDMFQAGKRVLLIDADMRLSKVERNLGIMKSPGLSNLLVGDNNGEQLIQKAQSMGNLPVISCGDFPPNPTELLSSKRMNHLIDTLKKSYDYIIIDLPPVGAVSDALIVSKLCDGMIIVARQDYVDKHAVDDTIRQLKFNDANIIGFVVTCSNSGSKYYKSKYKKYYGRYGKRYGYYSRYGHYGQYGYYAAHSGDGDKK